MPLTPKDNSPSSSGTVSSNVRIDASSYNLHDEEIRAIEEYLGAKNPSSILGIPKQTNADRGSTDGSSTGQDFNSGLLGTVKDLTSNLNSFVADSIQTSSGIISSGTQMIFPEDTTMTYLSSSPGPNDNTISVASTAGFPDSGIISILNDVEQAIFNESTRGWDRANADGITTVEWIKYSGKSSTSFLNCQRSFMGTLAGSHGGNVGVSRQTINDEVKNIRDMQTFIPTGPILFNRRNMAWRNRSYYRLPILSLTGTLGSLEYSIRTRAGNFSVSQGYAADQLQKFINAANSNGILGIRSSGTYYLKSANPSYAATGSLTSTEANGFLTSCLGLSLAFIETSPDGFDWPQTSVPVFLGRVGLTTGFASGNTTIRSDGIFVIQGADGVLWGFFDEERSAEYAASSSLWYRMVIIPSLRTEKDRNS